MSIKFLFLHAKCISYNIFIVTSFQTCKYLQSHTCNLKWNVTIICFISVNMAYPGMSQPQFQWQMQRATQCYMNISLYLSRSFTEGNKKPMGMTCMISAFQWACHCCKWLCECVHYWNTEEKGIDRTSLKWTSEWRWAKGD